MGYEVNKGVGKRSRQRGAEVAWSVRAGSVITLVVIEMVVDELDDSKVHKVGEVATKELEELIFVFVLAAEIIKVLDSIAWVRCASGNV